MAFPLTSHPCLSRGERVKWREEALGMGSSAGLEQCAEKGGRFAGRLSARGFELDDLIGGWSRDQSGQLALTRGLVRRMAAAPALSQRALPNVQGLGRDA